MELEEDRTVGSELRRTQNEQDVGGNNNLCLLIFVRIHCNVCADGVQDCSIAGSLPMSELDTITTAGESTFIALCTFLFTSLAGATLAQKRKVCGLNIYAYAAFVYIAVMNVRLE